VPRSRRAGRRNVIGKGAVCNVALILLHVKEFRGDFVSTPRKFCMKTLKLCEKLQTWQGVARSVTCSGRVSKAMKRDKGVGLQDWPKSVTYFLYRFLLFMT